MLFRSLTVITVAPGGGYQIVNISLPYTAGSVAFKALNAFPYTTTGSMQTVVNYDSTPINQPAWVNATTGYFFPQIAGYYQLTAEASTTTTGNVQLEFLIDNAVESTIVKNDSTSAVTSVTASEVFYFDGFSTVALVRVASSAAQTINVAWSGILTNQAQNATANVPTVNVNFGSGTGTVADYAISQLENLQVGWNGANSSATLWIRTTAGTASLYGGWQWVAANNTADWLSADFDQHGTWGNSVPMNVTTTRINLLVTSTAGQQTAIFRDTVSGNTYRITTVLNHSYQNSSTMIEKLNT